MSNEVEIRISSKDMTGPGFDAADRRARSFGDRLRDVFDRAERRGNVFSGFLSRLGEKFTGSLSRAVDVAGDLFQSFFRSTSSAAVQFGTNFAASMATAATGTAALTASTGGVNLLIGALLALAAAVAAVAAGMVVLAPVVLLVGGAFGAAQTALVGLVGTIAVFKLGLGGLQEAWKQAEAAADGVTGASERFDAAMKKLAPSGRALIRVLLDLKPRFAELGRSVQERLLSGVAVVFRDLATKWLPVLKASLGDLAGSFNRAGKALFDALGKPQFIADIREALAGVGRVVERLGEAFAPLVGAFGRLARASVPMFEKLGDLIAGTVENFAAWIEEADKAGKLEQFMSDAAANLEQIWTIFGLVKDIALGVIEILFPSSQRESKSFLGGVTVFLNQVKKWLEDKDNRAKIQGWIKSVQDFRNKIVETAVKIIHMIETFDSWVTKVENIINRLKAIRSGLSFSLSLGGLSGFAHGGIVGAAASGGPRGGLTWVGEQGPELVRLPYGSMVHPAGTSAAMANAAGGGGTQTVVVQLDVTGADADLIRLINKWFRTGRLNPAPTS